MMYIRFTIYATRLIPLGSIYEDMIGFIFMIHVGMLCCFWDCCYNCKACLPAAHDWAS